MSWLYSQALVAEYSAECSSDGALSAPSSATHTPQAFSSHGKMTGFSRLSRYGMTCEPLTDTRGEALLTWFLEAFPAKTYPQPEREQESTASNPASGEKWRESSVRYDPVSYSWKTHRCLFAEDLPESSVILPRTGMTRDGLVYQPQNAVRRTSATGSGYWPTATKQGLNGGSHSRKAAQARDMWPTPTATMAKGWSENHNRAETNDRLDYTIEREAYYATPAASDATRGGKGITKNMTGQSLRQQVGGRLNPTWVEWLMGWPEGWTDLKPLAMDRFREWQRQHSPCLQGA